VIHVPGEASTIQGAIDMAPDGSTIMIAPGVYRERVLLDGRSLHVLGMGGAAATQVVGDGSLQPIAWIRGGSNRIEGVTFEGGRGETGRGASLQRGTSVFVSCGFVRNTGGVEALDAKASFENCHFTGNRAGFAGGGLLARRSEVQLDRCRVEANVATTFGGGVGMMEGELRVQGTLLSNNRVASGAWGGGLYADQTRVLVQGGAFEGNVSAESGPAAFVTGGSATFSGVRFDDNRSEGGWVVHGSGDAVLSLEAIEGEAGRIWTAEERADELAMVDPANGAGSIITAP
jgi:pectin methylesterase-like acyl-CoA thioesterase